MKEEEMRFLKESNAIEREYSVEALEDAMDAWRCAKKHSHMINIDLIKAIHLELMKRLNPRIAGQIRKCEVLVGGTRGTPPEEINEELRLLCNPAIYPTLSEEGIKRWHIRFEEIHCFCDGNGRTERILMNLQRIKIGLPILIIYEKEKYKYYEWFRS